LLQQQQQQQQQQQTRIVFLSKFVTIVFLNFRGEKKDISLKLKN